MRRDAKWPQIRHGGAPSAQEWHVHALGYDRAEVYTETAYRWAAWADARAPLARALVIRVPPTYEPAPGGLPARPVVTEWAPVPVAELARALAYVLPASGLTSDTVDTYRMIHVGPAGQIGATDGHRAHHSGPGVIPLWPLIQIAPGALDYVLRVARECGAPVVGVGMSADGRTCARVVSPVCDVWTATTPTGQQLPQLWQVAADEPVAGAGLCAELHADGPAALAALRAALTYRGEDVSRDRAHFVRLRADADGLSIVGRDFDPAGPDVVPLPGRWVLQTGRNNGRPVCLTVSRAQLLAALDVPSTPAALIVRDEWSPIRVEAPDGFGALVMPMRPVENGFDSQGL